MNTPASTQTPPISLLLPYAVSILHKSAHLVYAFWRHSLSLFFRFPWSTLISPVTYLLAPLTTFAAILLSITLVTPYHFILWLLDALFPIYVLCGVACITGCILGWAGRALSLGLIRALTTKEEEEDSRNDENLLTTKNDDEGFTERSAKRRRIDKKEKDGRVKFESPPRTFAYCTPFPPRPPILIPDLTLSS